MKSSASIQSVDVATYRIPTDAPEADGTLRWEATELIVVHVASEGYTGMGYSYTAAKPAASLVRDYLAPCLLGKDAFDIPQRWASMNATIRNIGRPGLGLMAIAAIDQALWDLKAKLLALPLSCFWGRYRESLPLYGSGGFTTYSDVRMEHQLSGWADQGLPAVKIKIGEDLKVDAERVRNARNTIGEKIALMVDANGAYDPRSALALMEQLARYEVCWLEEPVSSDDLDGLHWLRDRSPAGLAIAAGEYGWDTLYFKRMLAEGAVDVLQVDATRCGYTGFLQAAHLCDAFQVPLSAHCAPAVHASVCAAAPRLLHLEYFHDHVRIESLLFDGGPMLRRGRLWPSEDRPGHGLTLRRKVADAYRL